MGRTVEVAQPTSQPVSLPVQRPTPRPPAVTSRPAGPADRLEVVGVPGEGKPAGPGVRFITMEWMKERRPTNPQPPKLATGRLKGLARGFVSKAQWRHFFGDPILRRYAHEVAHQTPGGPKARYRRLPDHKRKGSK